MMDLDDAFILAVFLDFDCYNRLHVSEVQQVDSVVDVHRERRSDILLPPLLCLAPSKAPFLMFDADPLASHFLQGKITRGVVVDPQRRTGRVVAALLMPCPLHTTDIKALRCRFRSHVEGQSRECRRNLIGLAHDSREDKAAVVTLAR